MNHPDEGLIHDFVDDELSTDERAQIAAHLAVCQSCRGVAEWARRFRDEAVRVLGDASPEDENVHGNEGGELRQWAEIAARIRASGEAEVPEPLARHERFGLWPTPSAFRSAAAALLLVVSSATTYLILGSRNETGTAGRPAAGGPAVDPWGEAPARSIAVAYAPGIAELERILTDGRGRLQPEAIATLETSLEILNEAIRDVQDALTADPAHRGNLRFLDGMYHAKLDLLREAATLSGGA